MEEIYEVPKSIQEIHGLGRRFLIVWCMVYDKDVAKCGTLMDGLMKADFSGLPSALVRFDASANEWVTKQLPYHTQRPILMAFCGAFCITTINSEAEFDSRLTGVITFAKDFKNKWLAAISNS